jgi:hypothetical protein
MALAMVPVGSSRPIEKIVPGPLCFDAHFGAPLPPAPGAAAPPPRPPPRYATANVHFRDRNFHFCAACTQLNLIQRKSELL